MTCTVEQEIANAPRPEPTMTTDEGSADILIARIKEREVILQQHSRRTCQKRRCILHQP